MNILQLKDRKIKMHVHNLIEYIVLLGVFIIKEKEAEISFIYTIPILKPLFNKT